MAKNIELKVRVRDARVLRELQTRIATLPDLADAEVERQVDTYFRVVPGARLKLRERWHGDVPAVTQLIAYRRPDVSDARGSDYRLLPLPDDADVKAVLGLALGVEVRVEKVRTVWRWRHVRIHLDDVAGLGDFLEFEALVDATCGEAEAAAKVADLRARLQLSPGDVIGGSYRELALRAGAGAEGGGESAESGDPGTRPDR